MAPVLGNEISKAVDRAWKIPGLYRRAEAEFLYRLARRRGSIVEIGCWMGRSTSLLVQAAGVWGGSVTSIDPFIPISHAQASAERWAKNLKSIGLVPPRLMEMRSADAAAQWSDPIALLFIDGDHSYAAVGNDLRKWTPFVKVGGVVALHDMFYPSIPDVAVAVSEWWENARASLTDPYWRLVGLRDFTIAFERIK